MRHSPLSAEVWLLLAIAVVVVLFVLWLWLAGRIKDDPTHSPVTRERTPWG